MSQIEVLEARLGLLKLEEAFVAKKEDGAVTAADREELREARRAYREAQRQPAVAGAQPATIGADADVEEVD